MKHSEDNIWFVLGAIFATYFMLYPIVYFVYNWFIVEIGFSQYAIPSFWVGMAGLYLLLIVRRFFRK
jgi:hypothetical protein